MTYRVRTTAERQAQVAKVPGNIDKPIWMSMERAHDISMLRTSLFRKYRQPMRLRGTINFAAIDADKAVQARIAKVLAYIGRRMEREDRR